MKLLAVIDENTLFVKFVTSLLSRKTRPGTVTIMEIFVEYFKTTIFSPKTDENPFSLILLIFSENERDPVNVRVILAH